ncbi:MAG: hypothetical protein QOG84_2602 [Sphingomonadales bacterium]|nr:hypothetical protein [Sphingomonadales bacterium]
MAAKGRIAAFFDLLQAVLTCGAILVGAWWFFAERKITAHANLSIEAQAVRLPGDLVLIQATVKTTNVGLVGIDISESTIRLTSVVPTTLPLRDISRLGITDWPEKLSPGARAPRIYEDAQIQWYKLKEYGEYAAKDLRQVEPGETDIQHIDFVIPCTVKVANLVVWRKKPLEKKLLGLRKSKEMWWSAQSLLPLEAVCAKAQKPGTVQGFAPEKD